MFKWQTYIFQERQLVTSCLTWICFVCESLYLTLAAKFRRLCLKTSHAICVGLTRNWYFLIVGFGKMTRKSCNQKNCSYNYDTHFWKRVNERRNCSLFFFLTFSSFLKYVIFFLSRFLQKHRMWSVQAKGVHNNNIFLESFEIISVFVVKVK